jgi:hypothetical protein
MRQLRAAIARRLERGDTPDTVERELIAPSRVSRRPEQALLAAGERGRARGAAPDGRLRRGLRV